MSRARCKKCGGTPTHYFIEFNNYYFTDLKIEIFILDWTKKYMKQFSHNSYLSSSPKSYSNINHLSHKVDYKASRPRLNKSRGIDNATNIKECVGCKCGKTVWAFEQKAYKDKPEIFNRKSKSSYTKEFITYEF